MEERGKGRHEEEENENSLDEQAVYWSPHKAPYKFEVEDRGKVDTRRKKMRTPWTQSCIRYWF